VALRDSRNDEQNGQHQAPHGILPIVLPRGYRGGGAAAIGP